MWGLSRSGRQKCCLTWNLYSFGQVSTISTNFPLKWILKNNFLLVVLLFSLPRKNKTIHFFPLNSMTLEKAHILLLASHACLRLRADSRGMKPWVFLIHLSPLNSEMSALFFAQLHAFQSASNTQAPSPVTCPWLHLTTSASLMRPVLQILQQLPYSFPSV